MIYTCRYENNRTGEQKDQICTLDPDQIARVEHLRQTEGDEIAHVTACAIVLNSAYRELDAHEWRHMAPPTRVRLN